MSATDRIPAALVRRMECEIRAAFVRGFKGRKGRNVRIDTEEGRRTEREIREAFIQGSRESAASGRPTRRGQHKVVL